MMQKFKNKKFHNSFKVGLLLIVLGLLGFFIDPLSPWIVGSFIWIGGFLSLIGPTYTDGTRIEDIQKGIEN